MNLYHYFQPYSTYVQEKVQRLMKEKYEKMDKKIVHLKRKQTNEPGKYTNSTRFHDRIINLTDTTFTDNETKLLEKGLKHNLPNDNTRANLETNITDAENAITYLPEGKQEQMRHRIADILEKTTTKQTDNTTCTTDNKTMKGLKRKLRTNKLVVTKADKGNVTVVMNKQEYIDKTLQFITDTNCTRLKSDPTDTYQKEIRDTLKLCTNTIGQQHYKYINMNPGPPILRAQPKIHKTDVPMRPVINYRPAPAYRLAKHITTLLKDTVNLTNTYTIKNTTELINKLKDVRITERTRLVSFDIKDLYPSIPVQETIDILTARLNDLYDDEYIREITYLTKTVLKQNYFRFNNNIYKPTDGLGMGNPTSSILTEIFIQHLEDSHIPQIMHKHNITQYFRYVDDTFCITETDNNEDILKDLNGIHPNINYTMETETDKTLNFLDLTITRLNNRLEYGIYRKPTFTDTTINATSNHPTQHKLAAFRHMLHRLTTLPLSKDNYDKELRTIYDIAHNNGYKRQVIDKILKKLNNTNKQDTNAATEPVTKRHAITYTGPEIYKITNALHKEGLHTTFRTNNTLRQNLTNNMEKNDVYNMNGVYRLTCTCNNTYIGQTGRRLKTRYTEHIRSFRLNKRDSNFANHMNDHCHDPTNITDSMKLLHRQTKGRRLDILENMEIYKERMFNGNIINEQLNTSSDTIFRPLRLLKRNNKRKTPTDGHTNEYQRTKRQRT